jgi:hypothetical protein
MTGLHHKCAVIGDEFVAGEEGVLDFHMELWSGKNFAPEVVGYAVR